MKELKLQFSREADAWDDWDQPYMFVRVEREEDFNFIKAAVEKQQPMKVVHKKELSYQVISEERTYDHYKTVHYCPGCNHTVEMGDKYCSRCGQKLDWSTEEN